MSLSDGAVGAVRLGAIPVLLSTCGGGQGCTSLQMKVPPHPALLTFECVLRHVCCEVLSVVFCALRSGLKGRSSLAFCSGFFLSNHPCPPLVFVVWTGGRWSWGFLDYAWVEGERERERETLSALSLLLAPCPARPKLIHARCHVCSPDPEFCSPPPAATLSGIAFGALCGFLFGPGITNDLSGCGVQVRMLELHSLRFRRTPRDQQLPAFGIA